MNNPVSDSARTICFLFFLFVANEHVVVTGDLCVIWLTSGELAVYTDAENSSER